MLLNQFKALSINLNAQHVNGMTEKVYFVVFIRFFSLLPFFMNVRFDTWMKRANLCVREPR